MSYLDNTFALRNSSNQDFVFEDGKFAALEEAIFYQLEAARPPLSTLNFGSGNGERHRSIITITGRIRGATLAAARTRLDTLRSHADGVVELIWGEDRSRTVEGLSGAISEAPELLGYRVTMSFLADATDWAVWSGTPALNPI